MRPKLTDKLSDSLTPHRVRGLIGRRAKAKVTGAVRVFATEATGDNRQGKSRMATVGVANRRGGVGFVDPRRQIALAIGEALDPTTAPGPVQVIKAAPEGAHHAKTVTRMTREAGSEQAAHYSRDGYHYWIPRAALRKVVKCLDGTYNLTIPALMARQKGLLLPRKRNNLSLLPYRSRP